MLNAKYTSLQFLSDELSVPLSSVEGDGVFLHPSGQPGQDIRDRASRHQFEALLPRFSQGQRYLVRHPVQLTEENFLRLVVFLQAFQCVEDAFKVVCGYQAQVVAPLAP